MAIHCRPNRRVGPAACSPICHIQCGKSCYSPPWYASHRYPQTTWQLMGPVVHHHDNGSHSKNTLIKKEPVLTLVRVLHGRHCQENPSGDSARWTNDIGCWQSRQSLLFRISLCSANHWSQRMFSFIASYIHEVYSQTFPTEHVS